MSKIFFLLIFFVNLFYSDSTAALIPIETGYSDLNLSPSGRYLTYSFDKQPGIFLLDIKKNESILISSGNGCAYQSSWSPDERFLGFKIFKKSDGYIMQIPALYDIEKKEIIELSSPVLQAGVPSFSGNDLVVFTLSNFLMIKDMKNSTFTRVDLYHYYNLNPISKDC